jgi:hypothetical protein
MLKTSDMIIPKDFIIAAFLALSSLVLSYQYIVPEVCGVYHDDAIYVSTAKAIAQGDGYRLINLPNSPKQTKYPILYPLILAAIWKFWPQFPQNILYMQIMTSFLGSLAIGICYLFFVRFNYCSRFIAFTSCIVCITTPEFLYFSTNTLTEIPFLLLVVISLFAIDYYAEQSSNHKVQEFSLGILLALPFLCRSIGIVLIFSGLLFWFCRVGSIRWLMIGIIVTILPWLLWMYGTIGDLKNDPVNGYYTDYSNWWMEFGLPFMTKIVSFNLLHALAGSISLSTGGLIALLRDYSTRLLSVALIILGSIPWAAIILHKEKSKSLKWFLIGYFLLICIWPWPPYRFLIPILPFLIAYFFVGISDILKKHISSKSIKLLIISICCIFVTTNILLVVENMEIRNDTNLPFVSSSEIVRWNSYKNLFEWLKMNTSSEETIASGLDTMVYLYTGRSGIRPFLGRPTSLYYGDDYPATGTIKELGTILYFYSPKYLVQTPMPGFSEEKPFNALLDNLLKECPNCLVPAYIGKDSRFKIYEVNDQEIETLIH